MSCRIVIVGAGPGGLASAMLLARTGAEVTVLERLDRVGGARRPSRPRAASASTWGRPSSFTRMCWSDIFAACGHDLHARCDLIRLDPQYHLIFEAGARTARVARPVAGWPSRSRSCRPPTPPPAALHGRQPAQVRGLPAGPGAALPQLADLLDPALLKSLPLLRPWLSLDARPGALLRRPAGPARLLVPVEYLGMSPFNCPSLFSILSFLEYEYGVFHPIGGCGAGHGGDGAGGDRDGRADPPERAGRGDPVRGRRRSACAPMPASTGPTRW